MRWVSALVAAVVVVVGAGVAGCQPATVTDTGRSIYCEVAGDAPVRDSADKPTKVIASARYRCDKPGASTMTLTLELQHQNSAAAWVRVTSTTFTVKGADTVPAEDPFRSRQISAGCTDGAFRTRVSGSSTARGAKKSYDVTSSPSFALCRPALFSQN